MNGPLTNRTAVGAPAFSDLFTDDALRLETRRLWLRWPMLQDAIRLHDVAAMEAVARPTATWPHPLPEGEAMLRIERARTGNAAGDSLVLALTLKANPNVLIGLIGAGADETVGSASVGYLLGVEHQGRGLMTEALRAIANAVFNYTALGKLRGASGLTNAASRRVMEKAGFSRVGQVLHAAPARGQPFACDELELTREEWRGRPRLAALGLAPACDNDRSSTWAA